jgi:hypothetical protein
MCQFKENVGGIRITTTNSIREPIFITSKKFSALIELPAMPSLQKADIDGQNGAKLLQKLR